MKNKIDINKALDELTLEEKASLCSGLDFWLTKPIERLGIKSFRMSDGPHGLRREINDFENLGMKKSLPATALPPAVNLASTWDENLSNEFGKILAKECKNQGVQIILGPGINIKRSPLCGRNFEYLSEDPYLSGKLATSYINGCQKEGVGVSLKHFAANSQESRRMTINALVDERALREIYLAAFETAVKESHPATVMCSYNKINNVYSSDNKKLLTEILRDEWGFDGLVVSDWNATNDRVAGIKAGMDLEMPSSNGINDKKIVEAVKNGKLDIESLNIVVKRILETLNNCEDMDVSNDFIPEKDERLYNEAHEFARKIARESFVLLKNNENALPLSKNDQVLVVGEFADQIRYQGSGSSLINPYKLVNILNAFKANNINFDYAPGFSVLNDQIEENKENVAIEKAKTSKTVIFTLGLTNSFESEGFDRSSLSIPKNQISLLKKIYAVNQNIIVLLFGGSPVNTDWSLYAKSILNVYLPGEAAGEAIFDVVFGDYSPSGKLAETYAKQLEDHLSTQYFGMGPNNLEYRESIFVGYRYFDSAQKEVAFPFGHGLSYSTFKYSDLKISSKNINDTETLTVTFKIKNTGTYDAYEIAQLYVKDMNPTIFKADKELKGFSKVFLKKGETKQVTLSLNKRSFAYYSTQLSDWIVSSGDYQILVGSSSRTILLQETVNVTSSNKYFKESLNKEILHPYFNIQHAKYITNDAYMSLLGFQVPSNLPAKRGEMTMNSTIGDLQNCIIGKIVVKFAPGIIRKNVPNADYTTLLMIQQGMLEMPLRGLNGITSGLMDPKLLDGMLLFANKKRLTGLNKMLCGGIKVLKNIRKINKENKKNKKKQKKQ